MKSRGRGQEGFTLIELIAVLVVVGFLLVFVPMSIDSLVSEKELESEASRLGNIIRAVRVQSVLDQAKFAIHYDTEDHRYAVQVPEEMEQETNDPDAEPVTVLVLEENVEPEDLDWHDLPKGISIELFEGRNRIRKGRYAITFSPQGTVPPHILILESNNIASLDEDDRTRTIKISFPGIVSYATGRLTEDFKKTEAEMGR